MLAVVPESLRKDKMTRHADVPKHAVAGDSSSCSGIRNFVTRNLLLLLTVLGIIMGFALGFGLREVELSQSALMWIGMAGELYLRLLRLMILPLIVCSVISGTATVDAKSNGKISAIALIYIMVTNAVSGVVGILLSLVLLPDRTDIQPSETLNITKIETEDVFADLLRNIMPDNMVKATFEQTKTYYSTTKVLQQSNDTNNSFIEDVQKRIGVVEGVNVLGLIFTCMILGIAANSMKEKGKPFIAFFTSATETVMAVLKWILWMTPVGIASLIAASIAPVENVTSVFSHLGMFVTTVTVGIAVLHVIILPAFFFLIVRQNPFKFIFNIAEGWFIAFATTSTAAAMPELITGCEEKNKIDSRIVRFVIPFSVTLNANGSAVYIATAAMFIGKMSGSALSTSDIVMIGILVAFLSLALPSVPSSSIVALVMILTSLNIPASGVAMLFAVEWYLDRIRTACNATSHTFCSAVTYKLCRANLQETPDANKEDIENNLETVNRSTSTACENQNCKTIAESESSKL